jgi:predicted ATPase
MLSKQICRIVVTGAPGSGKTEFIERLKGEKQLAGFVFFEELARAILSASPHFRNDWPGLHREIYRRQAEREDAIGDKPFVTDRGTVDAFAFHPETMTDVGTSLEREYQRYTSVIQLGSAASLGEPYYCQDEIRREAPAEALEIEQAIRAVWGHHPAYSFIPAGENLEEKYYLFRHLIVDHITGDS